MKVFNVIAACAFAALSLLPAAGHAQEGRGDVVYVPTPQIVVDEMLRIAKVSKDDYMIDLGSGDGRIVITAAMQFGARGFGVDLDTYLLRMANANAKKAGVSDRAQFFERNIFETDLGMATVVSTYLLPEMNLKLRPKILALKPGTRVVAHDYHMGDWRPDEDKTLSVPEKKVGNPGVSYIYLWYVPARVAGKWVSKLNAGAGEADYEFSFEQLFQEIDGAVRVGAGSARASGKMRGEQINLVALPRIGEKQVRHEFTGRVRGDTIEGTVKIGEGSAQRQVAWTAKQTARGELRRAADEPKGAE